MGQNGSVLQPMEASCTMCDCRFQFSESVTVLKFQVGFMASVLGLGLIVGV